MNNTQDFFLLQGALENVLGKGVKRARTNVAFRCPFCGHRKPKLEIDLQTDEDGQNPWACWVCQRKGRTIKSLLKQLNLSIEESQQVLQYVRNGENIKYTPSTFVKLPEEFIPLVSVSKRSIEAMRVREYLYRRGMVDSDFIRYGIGYCSEGQYAGRVIIPSYDSNNCLNYFVARSMNESNLKRYMNPGVSRDIIFFENLIDWSKPIILCEGVFDAVSLRRNAVPILGKSMSKSLLKRIVAGNVTDVYVCLDGDALQAALKHCEFLMSEGKNVYLIRPEAKDPGEQGFVSITEQLQKAEKLSLMDFVKYKMEI